MMKWVKIFAETNMNYFFVILASTSKANKIDINVDETIHNFFMFYRKEITCMGYAPDEINLI